MSSIPSPPVPSPAARWTPARNVLALAAVSFLTDASSEIIAPLLPLFLVQITSRVLPILHRGPF
jgi:hypothetical protein